MNIISSCYFFEKGIQAMQTPNFHDVLEARRRIRPYLARTPMYSYPAINELIGTSVYIKHENYQPVGAFKVRGGINLISQLSQEERARGVIAASTGNHGQSVSYAARLFGVTARIVVPEGANPGKVAAMRGMGSEVIMHGATYDEAKEYCEALAREHGYRYIHSGNEPLLSTIIVPIGGGSGAAGASIVVDTLSPATRVIGVQSLLSPSAFESWHQHRLVPAQNRTFAEGLATGTAFELPQAIMQERLDDFILVSDEEIMQAMVWMIERAHTLVEAAGASPLAAAYRSRSALKEKKVGIVCSGGNTSLEHLKRALSLVR